MATFPSLLPNGRSYDAGLYPVTNEVTTAGSVRFLHGPDPSLQPLNLQFNNLTLDQARLIRDHYRYENGGHRSFLLSASVRAGLPNFSSIFPSTTRFRYTSSPQEKHKSGGLIDMTVQIQAVIE